jgi:hypothetical protein
MEPNMTDAQTPVESAPVEETTAPVTDDNQAPQDEVTASDATLQDTNDSDEIEDNDDDDWDSLANNRGSVQSVQPNDEGYIDPAAYKEQIKAEIREDMKFQERERRAWQKLEERYPELKTDREARQLVLAKRLFDVQSGGNGSLMTAGKSVMGRFTTAKQAGKADAQVSIRTQQGASVGRATAPRDTSSSDVRDRLRTGDNAVIQDVIKNLLDNGKI